MKHLTIITIVLLGLALTANAQTVPFYVPTNGLVGWWPFTGNTNDESGNGNNGTNHGASLTTDRLGNNNEAYSFNGSNNYIEMASSSSLDINTDISISFWFKATKLYNAGNLVFRGDGRGGTDPYSIGIAATDLSYKRYVDNGFTPNEVKISNTTLDSTSWFHIVASFNSATGDMKIYKNGTLSSQKNFSSSVINYTTNTMYNTFGTVEKLYVPFKGKIDDIGIWTRPLADSEVVALYNGISVGISEAPAKKLFKIYPNPSYNNINVQADASLVGSIYTLSDLTGRKVLTGKLNTENLTIELSDLASGIYTLNVDGNATQTYKVVKY